MSTARIYTVAKARKDQGRCSKCGDAIPAGAGYLYWEPGFRSSYKVRRCTKTSCYPRPSERESSLMQEVMAAQEAAEDVAEQFEQSGEDETDLQTALDDVQAAIENVASQYRDAAEAFNGQGPNAEKADELEYISLDASFEPFDEEDVDQCDVHADSDELGPQADCDACQENVEEKKSEWRTEQAQALRDALEEVQL